MCKEQITGRVRVRSTLRLTRDAIPFGSNLSGKLRTAGIDLSICSFVLHSSKSAILEHAGEVASGMGAPRRKCAFFTLKLASYWESGDGEFPA